MPSEVVYDQACIDYGRDPGRDPRPGDRLIAANEVSRRVTFVSVAGQTLREGLVVYETGLRSSQKTCSLQQWKRWSRKTIVAERGKDTLGLAQSIPIPDPFVMQINGLANRFCNAGGHSISTPYDETFLALLELGLVHVLAAYGKQQLHTILEAKLRKNGKIS